MQRRWGGGLPLCVSMALNPSDELGGVGCSCYLWASRHCAMNNKSPSSHLRAFFQCFLVSSNKKMHQVCGLASERLQRLLRKCQGHLCGSKRVWNEDGECVTLRWEVITGSSKAADYVNFTGHSLLGHNIFYPLRLCDTLTLGNESRSVSSSNVHYAPRCSGNSS